MAVTQSPHEGRTDIDTTSSPWTHVGKGELCLEDPFEIVLPAREDSCRSPAKDRDSEDENPLVYNPKKVKILTDKEGKLG